MEVISPTITIKVVGQFLDGLKLYILNKMKDTILNGQKNILDYHPNLEQRNKNRSNVFQIIKNKGGGGLLCSSSLRILANTTNASTTIRDTSYQIMFFHTNHIRAINRIGPHNQDVLSVIIGSLLGDAYGNRISGEGVRICYRQSIIHKDYLFWLYNFLYNRGYTTNLQPRQYSRTIQSKNATLPSFFFGAQNTHKKTRPGMVYYGYEFNTLTFRSFNWIHEMFYKAGKKIIPQNIGEYLTPLALAVLIMDDGAWTNVGVRIATNSFTLKEVELLSDVLKSKYNLETTIQKIWIKDQYSIYITKQSIPNLRNIVGPFMHSSMLYKLGIDNTKSSSFNQHTYI